ncbi:elongator complex protein 4 isoform X1 [Gallus gallus]|uniref:elongator complex protein 4 isoform X1 n=1 Tax=Gallus gallus TaxID=9031 RepID=UPI001AE9C7D2|nr:elongator complex protein 4 isoform X1 [Gallus gallus]
MMAAGGGAARGGGAATTSTSFRRSGGSRLAAVPGTRPALRHGQLLLSCGVPSLDCVLGGGLAVGTLLLIEEDKYGVYSSLLFKYFLAEGVVCGHDLFVASAQDPPANIIKELPAPLLDDNFKTERVEATAAKSEDCQDSMQIAWRYQNAPKVETSPTTSMKFGHYYDVSKKMSPELLQSIKWHSFFLPDELPLEPKLKMCNMNCGYARLLRSIQSVIYQEGFDGSHPQKKQKNILRIGIQSLGSLLWDDDICSTNTPEDIHSLTKFLYVLRGLLRKSLSACIITMPSHLIENKAIMERVTNLSDMVVGLESFIGSERETNPLYKDYHGLLHVHQIPRLNSLICDVSDTKDLAFRLKRKQFTVEWVQDNYLRQERNIYPPGFSYLLKQKDSAWGEGSLQHSTFLMSFLAKAPALASRLVRHSEPLKQTGSGRIRQTAELRMWCCGHRQEAPGLLVIST